jgi:hypothetical protein
MLGGAPFTDFEQNTVVVGVDITLEQEIFALFGNYGITDRWDVGVIIPIITVEARASAFASIVEDPGVTFSVYSFTGSVDSSSSNTGGKKTGISDVIFHTKYNFVKQHDFLPDMAVTAQITAPTGLKENLMGTGEGKFRGLFVASKKYGHVTPHLNIGYEGTTGIDTSTMYPTSSDLISAWSRH